MWFARAPGTLMSRALALTPPPKSPPPVRGRLDEEAKRSFLRMISHELRTPLNSIIGFSEVLRQELCGPLGSPQYKDYAGFISGSGHKMLKLVNQIVEIVRLESHADEMDLRPEPMDLAVGEAFHELAAEARSLDVRLLAEDLDAMPSALADARGLSTVLINLLQNAVAHSPPGATVRVRAFRAGDQVLVEIEDHGPGADPEDLPRLMRPFEQGQQTLTRSAGGAGLGLPIAKLITEAMGGTLDIRTAPGEGLVAVVGLPAA
ncbi:MAG: sensor histidine kinase [Caulobacteraceae bacterium]|nr:sensor histidine kinase [Caulobacteraceae bacterium]